MMSIVHCKKQISHRSEVSNKKKTSVPSRATDPEAGRLDTTDSGGADDEDAVDVGLQVGVDEEDSLPGSRVELLDAAATE